MIHFVTTLTNSYAPGLFALAQSLVENAGVKFKLTVVCYEQIDPSVEARLSAICLRKKPLNPRSYPFPDLTNETEWIHVSDLGEFPAPQNMTPRMRPNFNKPLIWRLPYEKLIYIDADMLCLGPLHEMANWDELTVVRTQTAIKSVSETPILDENGSITGRSQFRIEYQHLNENPSYLPSPILPWNAGLFCFRPNEETLQGIMAQSRSYTTPVMFGDQVILNDFFNRKRPKTVKTEHFRWNMSTWVSGRFPRLYDKTDVRILHFAHEAKPWSDEPDHEWQVKFWDLWEGFYQRATETVSNENREANHQPGAESQPEPANCPADAAHEGADGRF